LVTENKGSERFWSARELLMVLAVLLALTAVTISVARLNTGLARVPAALLIASGKASLVLFFFMGIGRAGKAVVLAFLTTILLLAVFIGLTFFDVAFR
jgi:cytochrome c oxidase subunit 4